MSSSAPVAVPDDIFVVPLVDLGEYENSAFAGVLAPLPDVGGRREGVTATFLDNAEEYYRRHEGFAYWRALLEHACSSVGLSDPSLVVEYGCGFGNGTLPFLDIFPKSKVVATDISPNLLAILRRLTLERGLEHRCVPVALDAHRPYIKDGAADLVFGTAILHHLADPGVFVEAAMRVLKPRGTAIFFEPLEIGYAIARLAIRDLCREAAIREVTSPAFMWLAQMAAEWNLQIERERLPGWRDLDDKWLFPRAVLQKFADQTDSELIVQRLVAQRNEMPVSTHLRVMLRDWKGLDPDDPTVMPDWAWELIEYYDRGAFSPEMRDDILFEGCVIFRKRK